MTWTVEMFPAEQAFIDFIWDKRIDNHDGRGEFIAPLRGGLIMLNNYIDKIEDAEQAELQLAQAKWLIFNELQDPRFQVPGFVGLKMMSGNWNSPIPPVEEDAESMDKWGVKRQTTDGQPIGATGLPVERIGIRQLTHQEMKWNPETKAYTVYQEQLSPPEIVDWQTERPLPDKILE